MQAKLPIDQDDQDPEQALKCVLCNRPITNPGNKDYISHGLNRTRAVHKDCKQKAKQTQ